MYPDPKRVRCHKVSVCLDQYEHNLLRALAEYQGEQMSVLLRDMVVRQANLLLGAGEMDVGVCMPESLDSLAA